MFEIRTTSPLDARWEARDEELILAVGRESDLAGADAKRRYHMWYVLDFGEAQFLKAKLSAITKVNVTIREK